MEHTYTPCGIHKLTRINFTLLYLGFSLVRFEASKHFTEIWHLSFLAPSLDEFTKKATLSDNNTYHLKTGPGVRCFSLLPCLRERHVKLDA